GAAVRVHDRHGARAAAAVRRENLAQPAAGRLSVAGDAHAPREALARLREVVDVHHLDTLPGLSGRVAVRVPARPPELALHFEHEQLVVLQLVAEFLEALAEYDDFLAPGLVREGQYRHPAHRRVLHAHRQHHACDPGVPGRRAAGELGDPG